MTSQGFKKKRFSITFPEGRKKCSPTSIGGLKHTPTHINTHTHTRVERIALFIIDYAHLNIFVIQLHNKFLRISFMVKKCKYSHSCDLITRLLNLIFNLLEWLQVI